MENLLSLLIVEFDEFYTHFRSLPFGYLPVKPRRFKIDVQEQEESKLEQHLHYKMLNYGIRTFENKKINNF